MNHGTRGDVQPLVALGRELARLGHSPVLAVPEGLAPFVSAAGLDARPLPLDWRKYLHDPTADRSWLASGDSREVLAGLRREMAAHSRDIARGLLEASDGADLILSGALTEDAATVIAEARSTPLAMLHTFPLRRNSVLASPFVTGYSSADPAENDATHVAFEQAAWQTRKEGVNTLRAALGLEPTDATTPERARLLGAVELQAYSANLIRGLDWPDYRPLVGWLELDPEGRRAVGEHGLDPQLRDWLDAGCAPGYFGFGSTPVADGAATVEMIEDAVTKHDQRAVVAAGWAGLPAGAVRDPQRVHLVSEVDHSALMPRCAFAVHHGGAGTTGICARVGLPTLVTSIMSDQAMWGEAVLRAGVGLHRPLRTLDGESLGSCIEQLLGSELRTAAARLGEAVRAEPSQTERAADILIAHAKG
jgi:UDP:flavonoid glycosyltransferase YjiC (YdhE family)